MAVRNEQLRSAAIVGDLDRVKFLAVQAADPAYRYVGGYNAIMYASGFNRLPVVRYLITLPGDHAANVSNAVFTALNYAVSRGNYDITGLLRADGRCDPTIVASDGGHRHQVSRNEKASARRREPPLRRARREGAADGGLRAPRRHRARRCPHRVGATPRRRVCVGRVLGVTC